MRLTPVLIHVLKGQEGEDELLCVMFESMRGTPQTIQKIEYDLEDKHYPSLSTACRVMVDFPGGAIHADPSLQVQVGEHEVSCT